MRKNSNSKTPPLWRTSSVNKWSNSQQWQKKAIIFYRDKSKQIYKVKINNVQGYGPYQINQEELSVDISKFPPVTWFI